MNLSNLRPEFLEFYHLNQAKEITLEKFVELHSNPDNLHNHTIANLYLYFNFQKYIDTDRVVFYPGCVWLVNNSKHRFFLYNQKEILQQVDFSPLLLAYHQEEVRKKVIIYSDQIINFDKKLLVQSKNQELCYDLNLMFDRASWKNSKKYYNHITYPFNQLNKPEFTIRDLTKDDFEQAEVLYNEWVKQKLENPNTFRLTFSSGVGRYLHSLKVALFSKIKEEFFVKGLFYNGQLCSVRVIVLTATTSYDICFYSDFKLLPSQSTNYFNTYCMKELKDRGIQIHNCGVELDKNLKMFKSHFPHFLKPDYKYNLVKRNQIKIAHESPVSIFNEVQNLTDYDYFLVHLLEESEDYLNNYVTAKENKREIILDNSIFELGEAFDSAKFAEWVKDLEPTWYIVPDVLEGYLETIKSYREFTAKYKDLPGKKIGVLQGKTYEELKQCYVHLHHMKVDMIGISFDYSYYEQLFPISEDVQNKFYSWVFGRERFLDQLFSDEDILKLKVKPIHLLGCGLPQEFVLHRNKSYSERIYSLDTSNPIVHGIKGIKYQNFGLETKESQKLFTLINSEITKEQLELIKFNISTFKSFVK